MTDQERFTARGEKIVGMWINGELETPHDAVRALVAAFVQVRREALEEAVKLCEADAAIDDERGYYGKQMAQAIRKRATG